MAMIVIIFPPEEDILFGGEGVGIIGSDLSSSKMFSMNHIRSHWNH